MVVMKKSEEKETNNRLRKREKKVEVICTR